MGSDALDPCHDYSGVGYRTGFSSWESSGRTAGSGIRDWRVQDEYVDSGYLGWSVYAGCGIEEFFYTGRVVSVRD